MSERFYTCDICTREGNDETSCFPASDLIQAGENVVCQGCLECGDFPELEDLPQTRFVPPEDARIAELEAIIKAAPHRADCRKLDPYYKASSNICTCWKSKAEQSQA